MPKGVPKDKTLKRQLLTRYRIALGHLEKVIRMLDKDDYCIDIVHQSIAVQAALRKADHEVLRNHLKTCLSEDIKKGKSKKTIDEVMKVLEKI